MILSDIRDEARRKLEGKWGKAACITLAYTFIFFVIGFIEGLFPESVKDFLSLITLVIEMPLAFGLILSLVKLYNSEDVKAFDFFSLGFSNFGKSWSISLKILLKMLIPIILVIVSYVLIGFGTVATIGSSLSALYNTSVEFRYSSLLIIGVILLIISSIWATTKSYYYQLAYIIAAEEPEISASDAVIKSQELMNGKRAKLFLLELSFIGWAILAVFTLGIGYLWLAPYIQFSIITFYKSLIDNSTEVKVEVENDNPIKE